MIIHSYNKNSITIIMADKDKYLVPKNLPEDIDITSMGKPTQIIFDNSGVIPEFEEREVNE